MLQNLRDVVTGKERVCVFEKVYKVVFCDDVLRGKDRPFICVVLEKVSHPDPVGSLSWRKR